VRFSESQKHILGAMRDGATLKVHRTMDGDKAYRLYPLEGPAIEVKRRDVESLKRRGLIASNMKFPAATYLLTNARPEKVEKND
jgi:hypothetical protein